jgi:hypothetical protein
VNIVSPVFAGISFTQRLRSPTGVAAEISFTVLRSLTGVADVIPALNQIATATEAAQFPEPPIPALKRIAADVIPALNQTATATEAAQLPQPPIPALKRIAADVIPALKQTATDTAQLPEPPIRSRAKTTEAAEAARKVAAAVAQAPNLLEVSRAEPAV